MIRSLARLARAFYRAERASSAAEFALVLPAALLLFFGIIDGGRYMWSMNRLEKAVQFGTRYAVVTGVVPTGLDRWDLTATGGPQCVFTSGSSSVTRALKAGDTICADALGTITCTKASATANATCSCTPATRSGTTVTGSCPSTTITGGTATTANTRFNNIVGRMRVIDPSLTPADVTISYSGSGIGYAKDPAKDDAGNDLSDIAPIVTVSVNRFRMRALFLLGGRIPLPGFRYSQTMEDGEGQAAF